MGMVPVMRQTTMFAAIAAACLMALGCGKEEAGATPQAAGVKETAVASLASLAEDGPAFLYFAKKDCGSNSRAVALVQSVYQPYEGKVTMRAVVNTDDASYAEWSKRFGTTMELLSDEDLALVRELGFRESQHLVIVEKGGKVREIPGGYGREALEALNQALAEQAGVSAATLDLADAPDYAAYG